MSLILEEKLPPPKPAAAANCMHQSGVLGRCTSTKSDSIGVSSKSALTSVQFLPPNRGSASV